MKIGKRRKKRKSAAKGGREDIFSEKRGKGGKGGAFTSQLLSLNRRLRNVRLIEKKEFELPAKND